MFWKNLTMAVFAVILFCVGTGTVYAIFTGATDPKAANVTVVEKTNHAWPVRGMVSMHPCAVRACYAI